MYGTEPTEPVTVATAMDQSNRCPDLAKRVVDPTALLDYQEGAIVHRTLLEVESARSMIFALDDGETIHEHTAPHDTVCRCSQAPPLLLSTAKNTPSRRAKRLVCPQPNRMQSLLQSSSRCF